MFYKTDPLSLKQNPCAQLLSRALLLVTPWAVTRQAPPSMQFSRQEFTVGCPFPTPGSSSPQSKTTLSYNQKETEDVIPRVMWDQGKEKGPWGVERTQEI